MKILNVDTTLLDVNNKLDEVKMNSILSDKIDNVVTKSINNKTNNSNVIIFMI